MGCGSNFNSALQFKSNPFKKIEKGFKTGTKSLESKIKAEVKMLELKAKAERDRFKPRAEAELERLKSDAAHPFEQAGRSTKKRFQELTGTDALVKQIEYQNSLLAEDQRIASEERAKAEEELAKQESIIDEADKRAKAEEDERRMRMRRGRRDLLFSGETGTDTPLGGR